jgi:hypothetical protein
VDPPVAVGEQLGEVALTVMVEERMVGYTLALEVRDGLVRIPVASLHDLKAELRKVIQIRGPATPGIEVKGSASLKLRDLLEVMDACRSAGITSIRVGPPPNRDGRAR